MPRYRGAITTAVGMMSKMTNVIRISVVIARDSRNACSNDCPLEDPGFAVLRVWTFELPGGRLEQYPGRVDR
jgi:hypothetical protein